jgi:hypothetical protein
MYQAHLQTQSIEAQKYTIYPAKVIAQIIKTTNHQFARTYSLMKNIK